MMIIKELLKPFEKTFESRRYKIVLYILTSIILAPIAACLANIGFRPVYIIWFIWILIIPVTYGIYLVWSAVTESSKKGRLEPIRKVNGCSKQVGKIPR